MATFLFAYRVPADFVPGTDPAVTATWFSWFNQLGDHVTDRGHAINQAAAQGNIGPGTRIGGYSVITAADLEEATALAKGCPAIDAGGGVEVGQVIEVPREG